MRLQSANRCLEKNVSTHPLLALNVRLRECITLSDFSCKLNTDTDTCKPNSSSIQAKSPLSTSLGLVSGLPAPKWLSLSDSFTSRIVDLTMLLTVDLFRENA